MMKYMGCRRFENFCHENALACDLLRDMRLIAMRVIPGTAVYRAPLVMPACAL